MSLSALSDELTQVRTKKKEFLAQIDRIIRGDSGLPSYVRVITKENAATSPTIWNECFESI